MSMTDTLIRTSALSFTKQKACLNDRHFSRNYTFFASPDLVPLPSHQLPPCVPAYCPRPCAPCFSILTPCLRDHLETTSSLRQPAIREQALRRFRPYPILETTDFSVLGVPFTHSVPGPQHYSHLQGWRNDSRSLLLRTQLSSVECPDQQESLCLGQW
jgi:hypothetical protein